MFLLIATSAAASPDLSTLCDRAADEAARRTGVPLTVLKAISLTETGRKRGGAFRPWPWTVNMEGKGLWFDSEDDARAYVYREFKRGARSFDVGCFQINYKWHGQAFESIDQMFNPLANALYAADFLNRLYQENGSWEAAAGAYHSNTPVHADRYRERFKTIHARLSTPVPDGAGEVPQIPDIVAVANRVDTSGPARAPRVNRFPLLMTGAPGGLGSLVPVANGNVGPLSRTPDRGSLED